MAADLSSQMPNKQGPSRTSADFPGCLPAGLGPGPFGGGGSSPFARTKMASDISGSGGLTLSVPAIVAYPSTARTMGIVATRFVDAGVLPVYSQAPSFGSADKVLYLRR
jgi:hypothetical protein